MAGGLIEIVTYGSQDLYLTGTPEITFFKVVYRRHTNFSIESIRVNFDDTVGFGLTSNLTIPKVGDLINKMYLELVLPKMDLKRDTSSNDLKPALDAATENFDKVKQFMSITRRAYVGAFEVFIAENNNSSAELIRQVSIVFNEPGAINAITEFEELLGNTPDAPFIFDEVNIQGIVDSFPTDEPLENIFKALTVGIDKSIKTQNFYFIDLRTKREDNADETDDNIKFAWVDRIGHAIIDEVEIRIGGDKIDRQFGDWINIWYELTANRDLEKIYFKMIGNVEELTSFDRNAKPKYKLRIPMQFWFCRYTGLSIPLVALEFHDVTYHIKFRKIEDVSYIENGRKIFVSDTSDKLFLDEVPGELGLNIDATLLIDYIYLDSSERRRFAQSSHEYLIDQIQILEVSNINKSSLQCVLNNFCHPSKELIWVSQKRKYTKNLDGYTKLRWDNYSLTDENKGNPVKFSTINFHSYTRVPKLDSHYYNYVQPNQHHKTTPSDGINVYSFSLFPEEHQPSGSANLSRLSKILMILDFDPILFPEDEEGEILDVRIYTRNVNILRFLSGMGALAYTYG